MINISAEKVIQALDYPQLISALRQGFAGDICVPQRSHFDMENPQASTETTLLIMPAWQAGGFAGVKLVTVAPDNSQINLPSIQGSYLLFEVKTGQLLCTMDAPAITAKRTAAASALASSFLSRKNSKHLLIVGTGTLAPELIKAHSSVRALETVTVWGRDPSKAQAVIEQVKHLDLKFNVVDNLEQATPDADIISCATLSKEPLIFGKHLVAGQHLDMVGAYRPNMREMDDECLQKAKIFVDNVPGATKETGDIAIPLQNKVISLDDIKADLFSLCKAQVQFQRNKQDITIFKSVGHALEDLAAAKLVYQHAVSNVAG
ncbi:ornithine cyclodeaminase family protein [Thalassotalea sp. ND16A]|uniref:ornithine cyclodeaminase family protein n=1 Tax=Thalassotalea sp. ND16A TaxID=1535422 RepID=UPI00051A8059|nr:ornithine cyclodeaminase family protein [Thalassotalea sp. ND16A]KGJ98688.1 Ornithine cyclodeaminase [Thalassotalea sp. ND16A]